MHNRPLMLTILGGIFAFLYIPISALVALSFNEGGLPTAWTGFSANWYEVLWHNADILHAATNTLIVGLISAVLATFLGTFLAIGVEIRRRKGRAIEALIFAPMIIPDIMLAIALLSFFSLLKVPMGLHMIIAAHVVFSLAFVCAVVRARLRSFNWSIVEASTDLGASASVTYRRIVLPVLAPAIIAGGLLAFTLSVDEFIIAFFTAGAGRGSRS
jgi:spermidine/putrescine transport system permease protein